MEELFKIPTVLLILSSNLKYKRKTLQKIHQRQKRRLLLNAKSPLQLFSLGVIQYLLEFFQEQEAYYQMRQFMNKLNNVLGIEPGTKCSLCTCLLVGKRASTRLIFLNDDMQINRIGRQCVFSEFLC